MNSPTRIFDRSLLAKRKSASASKIHQHNFLIELSAEIISERLSEINQKFPIILNLGCNGYDLSNKLSSLNPQMLVSTELTPNLLFGGADVVMDDELLAFAPNSFDLVISILNLHFINDLPGTLSQIRQVLKPGGILIASLFGEQSLRELRNVMFDTDLLILNAVSPHIIPFIEIKTLGQLLQRAGFIMPVVDSEIFTVSYKDPISLIKELRGMAVTNILTERSKFYLGKTYFSHLVKLYKESFSQDDSAVTASFEILNLIGIK